jgi:hypothetical protein
MVDATWLLGFAESEIRRFELGEIALSSLVERLEGVVGEAETMGIAGADRISDAWLKLEICNAVTLDRMDRGVWLGWWPRRARRALREFDRLAQIVLRVQPDEAGPAGG